MVDDFDKRFDRLEIKIDKLSEAIVNMARIEERMITLFKRMDTYDSLRVADTARIAELERVTIGRGAYFRLFDRLSSAIVGASVALVVTWLSGATP